MNFASLTLVGRGGFASLEPPDKMSTGHISPTDKFDKSNFLLIRIHKVLFIFKNKRRDELSISHFWWEGVDSNHRSR